MRWPCERGWVVPKMKTRKSFVHLAQQLCLSPSAVLYTALPASSRGMIQWLHHLHSLPQGQILDLQPTFYQHVVWQLPMLHDKPRIQIRGQNVRRHLPMLHGKPRIQILGHHVRRHLPMLHGKPRIQILGHHVRRHLPMLHGKPRIQILGQHVRRHLPMLHGKPRIQILGQHVRGQLAMLHGKPRIQIVGDEARWRFAISDHHQLELLHGSKHPRYIRVDLGRSG